MTSRGPLFGSGENAPTTRYTGGELSSRACVESGVVYSFGITTRRRNVPIEQEDIFILMEEGKSKEEEKYALQKWEWEDLK